MSAFLVKEGITVHDMVSLSTSALSAAGIDQPRLDAEILLAEVIGQRDAGLKWLHSGFMSENCWAQAECDLFPPGVAWRPLRGGRREDIYIQSNRVLSAGEVAHYQQWIERRLAREPVAYILGRREFWSLNFKVTSAVLIPRPETEGVIDRLLALQAQSSCHPQPNILDLCTGSGILAVVAAKEIPGSRVFAVDISAQALQVAQENAQAHQVADRVSFFEGDLFEGWQAPRCRQLDFILCNPPYIESGMLPQLQPEICDHEPALALDGGSDGLKFLKRIIPTAVERLRPGGFMILEMAPEQAPALTELMASHPALGNIVVTRDYSGRDRVVSARKEPLG